MTMETAIAALEAYGYEFVAGSYRKPGRATQRWIPEADGFERVDDDEGPVPFRPLDEDELVAVNKQRALDDRPILQLARHNFKDPDQEDLFVWFWPADEIERIYSHAVEQRAAGWPDLRTDEDREVDAQGGRLALEGASVDGS